MKSSFLAFEIIFVTKDTWDQVASPVTTVSVLRKGSLDSPNPASLFQKAHWFGIEAPTLHGRCICFKLVYITQKLRAIPFLLGSFLCVRCIKGYELGEELSLYLLDSLSFSKTHDSKEHEKNCSVHF